MMALRIIGGLFLGLLLAGGSHYLTIWLMGGSTTVSLVFAIISSLIGGVYTAIGFAKNIYGIGFFSILGYVLDKIWSMLNTAAALLVWLPACAIKGVNFGTPNADSKNPDTFIYSNNPRGGGFAATTIGTIILVRVLTPKST